MGWLLPKKQIEVYYIGRSRRGLTAKLHLRVSEHGLLADRWYDADWIREMIEDQDCTPVIPPKFNRSNEIPLSRRRYKQCNLVERCIDELKQFRHIVTRFDRKVSVYLAFARLAVVPLWISLYESAA